MSDIKVGDRVRVDRPAIEGVVNYVSSYNGLIDIDTSDGSLYATNHRDVVTKLASPLKVGDRIEGKQAFTDLPVGALVGEGNPRYNILRTAKGFTDASGITYEHASGPECSRTILFMPES